MLVDYATVLVFIVLGAVTVALMLGLSRWFAPSAPSAVALHLRVREVPYGSSWVQFNIRFYVVALIFIIFDVEVALPVSLGRGLPAAGLPRLHRSVHLHRDSARRAGVPVEGGGPRVGPHPCRTPRRRRVRNESRSRARHPARTPPRPPGPRCRGPRRTSWWETRTCSSTGRASPRSGTPVRHGVLRHRVRCRRAPPRYDLDRFGAVFRATPAVGPDAGGRHDHPRDGGPGEAPLRPDARAGST